MTDAMIEATPWLTLGALGAFHGLNPAMGWLFAVALGLQEQRRKAVLVALLPIALGHAAAIGLVVAVVSLVRVVAAPQALHIAGAGALIAFGGYKLLRPRSHPRWVGFRVRPPELALWSFLMATAHGAGLMLLPVLLGLPSPGGEHSGHGHPPPAVATPPVAAAPGEAALSANFALGWSAGSPGQDLAAVAVHTLAMLTVMGLVALLVYEKLGVGFLRKAWLNLDGAWAVTIVAAGILTLVT